MTAVAFAIDAEMTDSELVRIGQLVKRMPTFDDYDDLVAEACAELLAGDGGIETGMRNIREAVPPAVLRHRAEEPQVGAYVHSRSCLRRSQRESDLGLGCRRGPWRRSPAP